MQILPCAGLSKQCHGILEDGRFFTGGITFFFYHLVLVCTQKCQFILTSEHSNSQGQISTMPTHTKQRAVHGLVKSVLLAVTLPNCCQPFCLDTCSLFRLAQACRLNQLNLHFQFTVHPCIAFIRNNISQCAYVQQLNKDLCRLKVTTRLQTLLKL